MYHIFVVVALIASQNKIDNAKKYYQERIALENKKSNVTQEVKPVSKTGTIPLIPNYPPQPNNTDIIDQFKKESSQDKEALNKLAKADIEALGLDPVDSKLSNLPSAPTKNQTPPSQLINLASNQNINQLLNQNNNQDNNKTSANQNNSIAIPTFSDTKIINNLDDKTKNIETDIADDSKKLDEKIKQDLAKFDDSSVPIIPNNPTTKESSNKISISTSDKKDNSIPAQDSSVPKDKIAVNQTPKNDIKTPQSKDDNKAKQPIIPIPIKEIRMASLQKSLDKLQLDLDKGKKADDSKKPADSKALNTIIDQKQDKKSPEDKKIEERTLPTITIAKDDDKSKAIASDSDAKKSNFPTSDQANKEPKPDLITEKKLTAAEIKEERKLKKLNKLREKYLAQIEEDEDVWNNDEEMDEYHKLTKIIPQKKTPPKFVNYTVPPQLAVPYRSSDNLHIPIIINYGQKVELMFRAISENNLEAFNALFKSINKANIKNSYGDTALTFAILTQRHPIIVSALSQGANPDMKNDLCYTPLNIAIEILDYKTVGILLEMNANPNLVDESGRTYLMEAIKVGSLPIVDLLISKGVDINAKDKFGYTALDIAYRYRKDIIAKYLKKHGGQQAIVEYQTDKESLIEELKNRWE